jgi:hypothetical protein
MKNVIGVAVATCALMALSFWTGTSLGTLKAIEEYDRGFVSGTLKAIEEYDRGLIDGRKDALYTRPVSEELEMVCLGLWTATLVDRSSK